MHFMKADNYVGFDELFIMGRGIQAVNTNRQRTKVLFVHIVECTIAA